MLCLPKLHPSLLCKTLIGALSEDVIEVPCNGCFQICNAYLTLFLIFDNFFIFFLSLAGNLFLLPGKAVRKAFGKTFFQPWQWGSPIQHERQEHEA